jgi:hypothetical protein
MKRLILLFLLSVTSFAVFSQLTSQVQAKRGVFTEKLYLNGQWINRITPDLNSNDTTSDNVIATAKSVADFMRSRIKPQVIPTLQQIFSAGGALTQTNIINGGNNLFVWNNNLVNGYLFRFRIDNSNTEVTRTIYASDFSTASDFVQSSDNNLLLTFGSKTVNHIQQWRDGPTYIASNANYTNTQSFIDVDTGSLSMFSGSLEYNNRQHFFSIYKDSITLDGHTNKQTGPPVYNTTLILRGLPVSTGTPAYDLQTTVGGKVIQKVAPKIYTALLSQTGTADPTVTVLGTNSLGTIVWTRNSAGSYSGTLSGAFPNGKTFVVIGSANAYTDSTVYTRAFRASDNSIDLVMQNAAQQNADEFNNVSIEIRVYP